jgi:hypothetical protein
MLAAVLLGFLARSEQRRYAAADPRPTSRKIIGEAKVVPHDYVCPLPKSVETRMKSDLATRGSALHGLMGTVVPGIAVDVDEEDIAISLTEIQGCSVQLGNRTVSVDYAVGCKDAGADGQPSPAIIIPRKSQQVVDFIWNLDGAPVGSASFTAQFPPQARRPYRGAELRSNVIRYPSEAPLDWLFGNSGRRLRRPRRRLVLASASH